MAGFGRNGEQSSAEALAQAERHREWLELRRQGVGEAEIARRAGVSQQAVSKAILKHIRAIPAHEADALRREHVAQIQAIGNLAMDAYEHAGTDGARLEALGLMIKTEEQLARLLGLDAEYRMGRANGRAKRASHLEGLAQPEPIDAETLKLLQAIEPIVAPEHADGA